MVREWMVHDLCLLRLTGDITIKMSLQLIKIAIIFVIVITFVNFEYILMW